RPVRLADAAPDLRIQQDHVDGTQPDTGRELLEVDNHGVSGRWNADLLAHAGHPFQTPGRILQVVIVEVLDLPGNLDGLFNVPDRVGVQAQRIAGEGRGQSAEDRHIVRGGEDAALELVRVEAKACLEIARVRD